MFRNVHWRREQVERAVSCQPEGQATLLDGVTLSRDQRHRQMEAVRYGAERRRVLPEATLMTGLPASPSKNVRLVGLLGCFSPRPNEFFEKE